MLFEDGEHISQANVFLGNMKKYHFRSVGPGCAASKKIPLLEVVFVMWLLVTSISWLLRKPTQYTHWYPLLHYCIKPYSIPCLFANNPTIILACRDESNHPCARSLKLGAQTSNWAEPVGWFQEEESEQKHTWTNDDTRFRCSVDTQWYTYVWGRMYMHTCVTIIITVHSNGLMWPDSFAAPAILRSGAMNLIGSGQFQPVFDAFPITDG